MRITLLFLAQGYNHNPTYESIIENFSSSLSAAPFYLFIC